MSKHPVMDTKLSMLQHSLQGIRDELDNESWEKLSDAELYEILDRVNASYEFFARLDHHLRWGTER